jgi:hypothetical protein
MVGLRQLLSRRHGCGRVVWLVWLRTAHHRHDSMCMVRCGAVDPHTRGVDDHPGDGYTWWWSVFLSTQDYRPHLLVMRQCQDVLIHRLRFQNSPQ